MNDLRKAAEMALETLETTWGNGSEGTLKQWEETIQALRQALDDKPAVKSYCGGKANYCTPEVTPEVTPYVDAVNMTPDRVDEKAKSKQEPVAWLSIDSIGERYLCFSKPTDNDKIQPLYTAPPQKEWVGLTDADKQEAFDETQEASGGFWEFADYLEAKLKEKNA